MINYKVLAFQAKERGLISKISKSFRRFRRRNDSYSDSTAHLKSTSQEPKRSGSRWLSFRKRNTHVSSKLFDSAYEMSPLFNKDLYLKKYTVPDGINLDIILIKLDRFNMIQKLSHTDIDVADYHIIEHMLMFNDVVSQFFGTEPHFFDRYSMSFEEMKLLYRLEATNWSRVNIKNIKKMCSKLKSDGIFSLFGDDSIGMGFGSDIKRSKSTKSVKHQLKKSRKGSRQNPAITQPRFLGSTSVHIPRKLDVGDSGTFELDEFKRGYPQLVPLYSDDYKLRLDESSDPVLLRETTLSQDSYHALSILITFNHAYSNMNSKFKDGKYNLCLSEVKLFLSRYPKTFTEQNFLNLVGSIEGYGVMFRAFLSSNITLNHFDINKFLSDGRPEELVLINSEFEEPNEFSETIDALQAVLNEPTTKKLPSKSGKLDPLSGDSIQSLSRAAASSFVAKGARNIKANSLAPDFEEPASAEFASTIAALNVVSMTANKVVASESLESSYAPPGTPPRPTNPFFNTEPVAPLTPNSARVCDGLFGVSGDDSTASSGRASGANGSVSPMELFQLYTSKANQYLHDEL